MQQVNKERFVWPSGLEHNKVALHDASGGPPMNRELLRHLYLVH